MKKTGATAFVLLVSMLTFANKCFTQSADEADGNVKKCYVYLMINQSAGPIKILT